ncbi:MAG: hypothetical protein HYR56_09670 [Acidobacteria bacterium]|nr:hypothetical protein [Acidobacteriota bacterium]MBI3424962.1 hypothetical protein [Acidobacteriota bacterium]
MMQATKHLFVFLLVVLLAIPAVPAQEPSRNAATIPTGTQDVLIIIQQQQVRFTTPHPVDQMHLQVTDQAGEVVFDSGAASVLEIFWPLQYANGAPLKSGLYAYTLTLKEANEKEALVRRGHFIVDRAQDRDGSDRLWVTSPHTSGIGTELTVARDEFATVAGTVTGGERALGQSRESNGRASERGLDTATQLQAAAGKTAALTAGTTGYLAKFTSATDLGNSVMAEVGGNIGIGTASPTSKLTVQTPTASYGFSHTDGQVNLTSWVGTGTSGASGGWFGTKSNHALHFFTNNSGSRMTITTDGHVGIGTVAPVGELHIAGYGPFITLESRQNGARFAQLQNADGTLVFKPHGFGACCAALVIQAETGNVGIGTSAPDQFRKLDIVGGGATAAGITSVNDRAFLSLTSNINGQRRTWSVESGVYGLQDTFGIFNWQTGKALLFDPDGKLTVNGLQITGGADFAENFDVNVAEADAEAQALNVEAGMVVSIDPASPGKLQLSAQAYDRRVAGIISGAGGVKPGMMMSQAGTLANGQYPVALSGRVYCWVDATSGAVEPGDLLTTSATPGHAMKVSDAAQAQGAIIGKAMTGLKAGKGLVLVLVTLQ